MGREPERVDGYIDSSEGAVLVVYSLASIVTVVLQVGLMS